MAIKKTLRWLSGFGCAALLAAAGAAHAQSDDLTIGIVNMQRVMEQAPQAQAVMSQLSQEFSPRQQELQQLRQNLQEKQQTYQRDSSVMGEQERVALEREIREAQRELQRRNESLNEDFNIRRNEEVSALQQDLAEQIQAYAQDQGYDLVLLDTVALHATDAADITSEVVEVIQANSGN